ncbi:type II toxin-antitoxin system prevent-host-death family antitoxin [Bifidobacterium sp. ESL0728]|uniref:type II toxin-antitoxin system prevent-host-death family antitoxin n=1 Tax=Bifidobacterium sp. ESL0728 TaxID=2983220 RepID=UPI0023F8C458|nr:type II toxin-antitoxin system prevent-host-death family antitoxin [Bifidobacterium sp. ESL0728]WEV59750.1 type II toxin-antitoxin system prevent-host-death family antitoxin [Bifidobacterium sp. ESL0728]
MSIEVPLDTMVPISTFSRGGASKAFARVKDGKPVTVLRNNEPTYVIVDRHDYEKLRQAQIEQENAEARRQVEAGEGHTFSSVQEMRNFLDA